MLQAFQLEFFLFDVITLNNSIENIMTAMEENANLNRLKLSKDEPRLNNEKAKKATSKIDFIVINYIYKVQTNTRFKLG